MNKSAPSFGRIAAMVVFALSCFGLLLFLWLAFGGAVPLKPKGYRINVSFAEATQLATEADVRISGVPVGKVKTIEPDKADRALDRRDRARVALRAAALRRAGDPAPEDAARRDLRRADARQSRRGEGARERHAERVAGLGHRAARRDLPHVRRRHARRVPDLDAGAGEGDRRLRARPQRRARQPRAVRRGRRASGRHPQPPGGRGPEPRLQHRRRVRRAQRARRAAAVADRELQPRVRGDRVARRAAQAGVHRAADVRARVDADARPLGRVRGDHRPAHHSAATGRARAQPDAAGPRRAVARPRGAVPRPRPADRRVADRLPRRRAGARGRPAADRPARARRCAS